MREQVRKPHDELARLLLCEESLSGAVQSALAAGREPRLQLRHGPVLEAFVVAAERMLEARPAPAADLEGESRRGRARCGARPDFVAQQRPAAVPDQLDGDAHLGHLPAPSRSGGRR